MSVYRDPANRRGRRMLLISVIAALLVGALAGYLVARATDDDPTLAEQVTEGQAELAPAIDALELVPGHYRQAVRDGEVIEPAQYEGVKAQAATASDIVADAAPELEVFAPVQLEAATQQLDRLETLIEQRADIGDVGTAATSARQAIAEAAGDESAQLSE
jgi:hypothetical protein